MPSILLVVKHATLDAARNAKLMARIALETADADTPIRSARGATVAGWSSK